MQHFSSMRRMALAVLFISMAFCHQMTNAAVYDVTKYGAVGDGKTNDAPAFGKAWADVCKSDEPSTLLIPAKKTFLTYPISIQGPCQAPSIEIKVLGNVLAPKEKRAWNGCPNWISFDDISNLKVSGTGLFNAQGDAWWTGSLKQACEHKPTSLHFNSCNKLSVSGIQSKDSPKNHISISRCNDVTVSNIKATAPKDSPNTDGIDISNSVGVRISDSVIGTGDDCIAINNHCSDIQITNIKCGPGHGISVGSLGKHNEEVAVENILVQHCTITGADNGARIKTWEGGSGYAKSITYKNITMKNVKNPIIINQQYVDKHASLLQRSAVEISDVTFSDIRGTAEGKYGITLGCSTTGSGCTGITIENVDLTSTSGGMPKVNCTNAHGKTWNTSPEVDCLTKKERNSFSTFDKLRLF